MQWSEVEFPDSFIYYGGFASKVRTPRLEEVSTVRGSGWVADQYAKFH